MKFFYRGAFMAEEKKNEITNKINEEKYGNNN